MNPFDYQRADGIENALDALKPEGSTKFIAGGTNLIDLMKERVESPRLVVDITALSLKEISDTEAGGLRLGALATNAETASHPAVRERFPLLSQAILAGASPQLRNMATDGGNLLQRTRCPYFYDTAVPCNKRSPGSGCPARVGINRNHAILGASEACVATHPSDMCVALAALEAVVKVTSRRGTRSIPFGKFHRLPGNEPERDTNLLDDELITSIDLPPNEFAANSSYLKIRDRQSYAFALVSVAAALEMNEGLIVDAKLALGGVAHKPWRNLDAENHLVGNPPGESIFKEAANILLAEATGLSLNAFKIPLARLAIVRALSEAAHLKS